MNDHDHAFADPWLKKGKEGARLPDDARFACAYESLSRLYTSLRSATFTTRISVDSSLIW